MDAGGYMYLPSKFAIGQLKSCTEKTGETNPDFVKGSPYLPRIPCYVKQSPLKDQCRSKLDCAHTQANQVYFGRKCHKSSFSRTNSHEICSAISDLCVFATFVGA